MHALSAHAWDYLPALKTVFESVGLDYLYHVNDFNKERFNGSTVLNEVSLKRGLRIFSNARHNKRK
jgi:hypothetical protein